MSEKKFNAIINIFSAGMSTIMLVLLMPMIYNINKMSSDMDINFHWWDKASFFLGPIFLICAIIGVGYRGIRDLKTDTEKPN